MPKRKLVVIGLLGTTLDAGRGAARWDRWRPTVALTQHEDLVVDRLDLLLGTTSRDLGATVSADILHASPETHVIEHLVDFKDAWDFERVYGTLLDFAKSYAFNPDAEDYLVHITTGTHVAQICLFLLTESRHIPARLLQTSPLRRGEGGRGEGGRGEARRGPGTFAIIDLDLSKYDRLASRFRKEQVEGQSLLKAGIETRSAGFNALVERIEHVAISSRAPILLTGPTGAGKTKLAKRVFELKKSRRQVKGEFAEINCATLRGDAAMSALFGHTKGAFTGATSDRPGLLRKAHDGVLFLDEIGELGRDEQAMLLRALEEKTFYPMGSDREASSNFQLIAGTNQDLHVAIGRGTFREDLFARINLWAFRLPALSERAEDLLPNLDFELAQLSLELGVNLTMSREARDRFLQFARSWAWPGNFRDFNASVTRMATFAEGGRVTEKVVSDEIDRILAVSSSSGRLAGESLVARALGPDRAAGLDRFDRVQLEDVLCACREARSLSEAGRVLFAESRSGRTIVNDADRLRKYLARFELEFRDVRRA